MMKISPWWIILLVLIFIGLRLPFLNREFVLEEALHVKIARAVLNTGYPVVYLGQQQSLTTFLDRPPSLFFLMAPFIWIFGESEISARLTPLLFSILELFLVIYFGNKFFGRNSKLVAPLAAFLMGIHPYLIQTSVQVHFDQVYSFFSTLFLFLAMDKIINKKKSLKDYCQLGLAFFFTFAIKYDPSLIAIAIVTAFAFFTFRKFLARFYLILFTSIATFFLLFYLYALSLGHPEGFWVPINLIGFVIITNFIPKFTTLGEIAITRSYWGNNYYLLIRFLSWLSIPVILLSIYTFFKILFTKKLLQDPKVLFLALWFIFYVGFYLIIGWAGDYPRFFAPAMPPLFLLISLGLVVDYQQFRNKLSFKKNALTILVSLLFLLLAQTKGYLFLDHITGWIPKAQIPFFLILLSGSLIIFLTFKNKAISPLILFTLLYLTIGQLTLQYLHDLKSNFSLTNFYGVSGSKQAGLFLKEKFKNQEVIIFTYDPVAYYWGGRYYDNNNLLLNKNKNPQFFIEILSQNQISAFALPRIYYDEIERIAKGYGVNFSGYLLKNYPYYKKFGGSLSTEVYYK